MVKKRGKVSETGLFDSTIAKEQDIKIAETEKPAKIKNTYYLSAETDSRLELARVTLRGLTGKKISKSDIIDAALRAGIDELDTRGSDSYLSILLS